MDKKIGPTQTGFKKSGSSKGTGPVSYGWFPLGMGRGIKWTLWPTNVTLARQEKQGDRWLTTEEIHLSSKVLKEMAWRTSHWLSLIEKNGKKKSKTFQKRSA